MKGKRGIPLNVNQKLYLIECIEKHSCIWDQQCDSFKNGSERQLAFNEVAFRMSEKCSEIFTRSHIQEEWGKLRYCFTRILQKKLIENEDADEDRSTTWPYWNKMYFIHDSVKRHLDTVSGPKTDPNSAIVNKQPMFTSHFKALSPNVFRKRKSKTEFDRKRFINNEGGIMDVLSTVFGQADDPQNSANITLYNSANKSLCSNIESSKAKNDDTDFEHFPLLSTIYNIGSELTRTNFIDSEQKNLSEFGKCDKGAEGTCNNSANSCLTSTHESLSAYSAVDKSSTVPHPISSTSGTSGGFLGATLGELNDDELDGRKETNEYFGRFIIQTIQSVSRKNPTLGVLMRKEIMDVCCKFELKAVSE